MSHMWTPAALQPHSGAPLEYSGVWQSFQFMIFERNEREGKGEVERKKYMKTLKCIEKLDKIPSRFTLPRYATMVPLFHRDYEQSFGH